MLKEGNEILAYCRSWWNKCGSW